MTPVYPPMPFIVRVIKPRAARTVQPRSTLAEFCMLAIRNYWLTWAEHPRAETALAAKNFVFKLLETGGGEDITLMD